jgi:hypothetical protein
MAALLELSKHTDNIIRPVASWLQSSIQGYRDTIGELERGNIQLVVFPRLYCRPSEEINGGGKHEAIVVIGMFANEVNPSRSTTQSRLAGAVCTAKPFSQQVSCCHW